MSAPSYSTRARDRRAVRQKLHGGKRCHRLARPGFAHQSHGFALLDVERDAANGMGFGAILPEAETFEVFRRPEVGSLECLSGIEGITHAFEDEDQKRQHEGECEEGGEGQPGSLQVLLGL